MALLFIHGVNTRKTDPDYETAASARRQMFEEYVVSRVRKAGYSDFAVAEDAYWGDLGVRFEWGLKSVPTTNRESLGPADGASNTALVALLADTAAPKKGVATESLGPAGVISEAAAQNPAALVRAIFAGEAERFAPTARPEVPGQAPPNADAKGQNLAWMLMAVDELARDVSTNPGLIQAPTDQAVLEKIQNEVEKRYRAKLPLRAETSSTEQLGAVSDGFQWAVGHIKDVVNGAKSAVQKVADSANRTGTLLLYDQFRNGFSAKVLRFIGDVFVWLQRGRTATPSIHDVVKASVIAAASRKSAGGKREPLIVVTHSFGSEILYDLLSSGELDDYTIDLWASAGAQTSLFAEMRLYKTSPQDIPSAAQPCLSKPSNVKRWVNFYDEADILSYLHAPVFGTGVTDVNVSEGANLTNAHGHYFMVPRFYTQIADEFEKVAKAEKVANA